MPWSYHWWQGGYMWMQTRCNTSVNGGVQEHLMMFNIPWDQSNLAYYMPVKLLRSPSNPRSIPCHSPDSHSNHPLKSLTLHYHSPEPQLTPENSNMISLPSENPNWSLRPLITFQSLLFHSCPLVLCSHFHVPTSVSIFLFPIYCTVSVLLLSF